MTCQSLECTTRWRKDIFASKIAVGHTNWLCKPSDETVLKQPTFWVSHRIGGLQGLLGLEGPEGIRVAGLVHVNRTYRALRTTKKMEKVLLLSYHITRSYGGISISPIFQLMLTLVGKVACPMIHDKTLNPSISVCSTCDIHWYIGTCWL